MHIFCNLNFLLLLLLMRYDKINSFIEKFREIKNCIL